MIYRFAAPVPYPGLLLAGVLSVVGATATVLSLTLHWSPALTVVGVVLLAAGVLLTAAVLGSHRRQAATVSVDDTGWAVNAPQGRAAGTWAAVTRVAGTADDSRLTIEEGDDVTHILRPAGGDTAMWQQLQRDITARLDASRGYRNEA